MNQILQDLLDFVEIEYQAQRAELFKLRALPLEKRVEKNEAIAGLRVVDQTGNSLFLSYDANNSKFREGERLRLHSGSVDIAQPVELLREDVAEQMLVLQVPKHFHLFAQGGLILERDLLDNRALFAAAFERLEAGNQFICNSISALVAGSFKYSRPDSAMDPAFFRGLNETQILAASLALSTNFHHCIQGPPGTGKTHVLARIVEQLVAQSKRVLISAFTHRAIGNALRKIVQVAPHLAPLTCKVSRPHHWENLDQLGIRCVERLDATDEASIVGATCFALATRRIPANLSFDVAIFDEASQINLPTAVLGMMMARRYIFIGDTKQLSPIIAGKHENEWTTQSIMSAASKNIRPTMLNKSYRLNEGLCAFPSKTFYDGNLQAGSTKLIALPKKPKRFKELLAPEPASVWLQVEQKGNQSASAQEAGAVADLCAELFRCGLAGKDMAVITPFRAQARAIYNQLHLPLGEGRGEGLVVDTVDRLQGQERDVVIMSLAASDIKFLLEVKDFFFSPNRLNVSITRAAKKLIVIASPEILRVPVGSTALIDFLNSLTRFTYRKN